MILRILIEWQEASDALQEVYLGVWRKLATFDAAKASPVTCTATIARKGTIDRLRVHPPRETVPVKAAFNLATPTPA